MIAPRSVVLPAPFGPITVTIWPASTVSDTPCTASTLPYATCRARTSRSALMSSALSLQTAEVGLDDQRIALNLCRQAFGELLSEVHDDQTVGQPHHEIHVVLDQENRHALL